MRIYDVYRGKHIRACIRIWDSDEIEWTYRPEVAEWEGFWWSNDTKSEIERMIKEYPHLVEFPVSEFRIMLREKE
jgi:hypothetical protein